MTISPGAARLEEPVETIPNGSGAAAILAAGIGCAAIGVLAFAAELSPGLRSLLNFYNPVGPLSGKTTVMIVVWLAAWYGFARLWRAKTVNMRTVNVAAFILLGLGFLLTFPPFWYLFV
jgi:hypothetical protein